MSKIPVDVELLRDLLDEGPPSKTWAAQEKLRQLLASPQDSAGAVCDTCHGQGEVYSGEDQHFHYFDFQPPEPIMEVCPECGGEPITTPQPAGPDVEVAGGADIQRPASRKHPAYRVVKVPSVRGKLDAGALDAGNSRRAGRACKPSQES